MPSGQPVTPTGAKKGEDKPAEFDAAKMDESIKARLRNAGNSESDTHTDVCTAEALQDEIRRLTQCNLTLRDRLNDSISAIGCLQIENTELNEQIALLNSQNSDITNQVRELQVQLDMAKTDSHASNKQFTSPKSNDDKIVVLRSEKASLEKHVSTMTNQMKNYDLKVTALENEITILQNKNCTLQSQTEELRNENKALDFNLAKTHELLEDERILSADLMMKIDNPGKADGDSIEETPSVVFISDRDNSELSNKLKACSLHCEFLQVENIKVLAKTLSADMPPVLTHADHLVMLMGTSEMLDNTDGYTIAMGIIRVSKMAHDKLKIPVSVFQMPPVADPKIIATVALVNAKLQGYFSQMTNEQLSLIELKSKMNRHLKSQILDENGFSLSGLGIEMLTAAMTEQISPVKVKKAVIAGKNEQSSDETITEFFKIPEDCVGLIIGNKGSTIRAIQEMSDTQISIQYFKKGSEESAVAALITGTASKRNVAKTEIERLITEKKEKQTKRPQGDKTETPPSKRNK
jgi:hypothetical protein